MSSGGPSSGLGSPLAVITSTDKTGVIFIVTAIGLAFALVSLFIRVYVRVQFSPNGLGWDDGFIVGAFVISVFQNACVFLEGHRGLGDTIQRIDQQSLVAIQKAMYADDILYIASVWLTKMSVVLLYLRLSPKRSHTIVSGLNGALIALTAIASILILALRCDLSHPWIFINSENAQCAGLFTRWKVIAGFDIGLEILLFANATFLLHDVRFSAFKKAYVLFAFAFRLPLIAPIVMRLHYLGPALNSSNFTLIATYAIVCKQIEVSYAILSTVVPCLRPFMMATVTYYGGAADGHRSAHGTVNSGNKSNDSSNSRRSPHKGGFQLASITSPALSRREKMSHPDRIHTSQLNLVNSQGTHTVSVVADGTIWAKDKSSVGSTDSGLIMVRNDFDCSVDYQTPASQEVDR